jgi:hypothetical protein
VRWFQSSRCRGCGQSRRRAAATSVHAESSSKGSTPALDFFFIVFTTIRTTGYAARHHRSSIMLSARTGVPVRAVRWAFAEPSHPTPPSPNHGRACIPAMWPLTWVHQPCARRPRRGDACVGGYCRALPQSTSQPLAFLHPLMFLHHPGPASARPSSRPAAGRSSCAPPPPPLTCRSSLVSLGAKTTMHQAADGER